MLSAVQLDFFKAKFNVMKCFDRYRIPIEKMYKGNLRCRTNLSGEKNRIDTYED